MSQNRWGKMGHYPKYDFSFSPPAESQNQNSKFRSHINQVFYTMFRNMGEPGDCGLKRPSPTRYIHMLPKMANIAIFDNFDPELSIPRGQI